MYQSITAYYAIRKFFKTLYLIKYISVRPHTYHSVHEIHILQRNVIFLPEYPLFTIFKKRYLCFLFLYYIFAYLAAIDVGSEKPTVAVFAFSTPPNDGAVEVVAPPRENPAATPKLAGCVLDVVADAVRNFNAPPNKPE